MCTSCSGRAMRYEPIQLIVRIDQGIPGAGNTPKGHDPLGHHGALAVSRRRPEGPPAKAQYIWSGRSRRRGRTSNRGMEGGMVIRVRATGTVCDYAVRGFGGHGQGSPLGSGGGRRRSAGSLWSASRNETGSRCGLPVSRVQGLKSASGGDGNQAERRLTRPAGRPTPSRAGSSQR